MKAMGRLMAAGLYAILLSSPISVSAQAPPGPIIPSRPPQTHAPPPVKEEKQEVAHPRKDLNGRWALDLEKSDDPRKKMQDQRRGGGSSSGGGGPYGGGGGGGRMGGHGGRGPYGRRGGSRGTSDADREKMADVFRPAHSIVVVQKTNEVSLTNDRDEVIVYLTDGRKPAKSKDPSHKELSAKWEGRRLASEEKGPNGSKIYRSLELSSDGLELRESVSIENGRNTLVYFRYVYAIAKEDSAASQ